MDWGKFRDALDYGHHQLGISEELDNPQMRSEAYLNLARAHERLGEFRSHGNSRAQTFAPSAGCLERSLMYARHSLYNECEAQSRNGGLVHLTVASVYLELGGFRRCLEVSLNFKAKKKLFNLICGSFRDCKVPIKSR